jgi:hypothetical protein
VRDLAKIADAEALPVLVDIYNNAQDGACRLYALEAMARLQPDRAIDLLLNHLQRVGNRDHIINYTLPQFADDRDAERIIAVVIPDSQPISRGAVRLRWEKLGERGRKTVEENNDRLDADARMWVMWKLQGLDLSSAAEELHAAGVIAEEPQAILQQMRLHVESRNDGRSFDLTDPDGMIGILSMSGILTMFDAETGVLPCRHDRLVENFGDATTGRFQPQFAVQFWRPQSEDDFTAPYIVQFVFNDRLYRFGAENYGDWYDVASVQRALNVALEDAGRPERFLPLAPGGQFAIFVFADPQTFLPIAAKNGLPLAADAMESVRQGQEFERRVFER